MKIGINTIAALILSLSLGTCSYDKWPALSWQFALLLLVSGALGYLGGWLDDRSNHRDNK